MSERAAQTLDRIERLRRDLWKPEFEVTYREVVGQDWPLVFVEKWERNAIGERRFVGSSSFSSSAVKANARLERPRSHEAVAPVA
jgi:hypothetical protein